MHTDVLVVGAGPTGLMLTNQLVRRGVRAQIIDSHSGPAQQTRAMGVQARTLEIHSGPGIAGRAQVPTRSFHLLQPDGHVGFAGLAVDAESIARYLAGIHIK
jgi:2-polyprenyl-6-methoxyphenol hydroxylase-like FAD-dependent oxidoreductase